MNNTINYYAHTKSGMPQEYWESLEDHLSEVAELAAEFGKSIGFPSLAKQIGLWHDVGKYSVEFQEYLKNVGELACEERESEEVCNIRKVDHSTPGAQFAFANINFAYPQINDLIRTIVANAVAGHHGGLPDQYSNSGKSGLLERLEKNCNQIYVPSSIANNLINIQEFQHFKLKHDKYERQNGFRIAFLNRMLFSCLVDADFLATEKFMTDGNNRRPESQVVPKWNDLLEILTNHVDNIRKFRFSKIDGNSSGTELLEYRDKLFRKCSGAGQLAQGFYQLEASVGSGKTFSSLAFAVKHAEYHKLNRIIYAIPFTSIVDQTASEFRKLTDIFGPNFLIEHHSNLLEDHDTTENRLLSENWDAPLVITTNVQLFESLFSNRPGECRKLHNIAKSVIILDEAQTIPPHVLLPCLKALEELVRNYSVTVLICSATPPAIVQNPSFPQGIKLDGNIANDLPSPLAIKNRVKSTNIGRVNTESLAEMVTSHKKVLCIVNTRRMAQELYRLCQSKAIDTDGIFHLSTWMCGEHRREVLAGIRERLACDEPKTCRVISTQVVEAGVDIDFPVVYRAIAGIDSLTQASGRCNREGKLAYGEMFIFEPDSKPLQGFLGMTIANAKELLRPESNPIDSDLVRKYFEMTLWKLGDNLDKHKIILGNDFIIEHSKSGSNLRFMFRDVAKKFRMIEDGSLSIVVPFGHEGSNLVKSIVNGERLDRHSIRKLQRYSVSIHEATYSEFVKSGVVLASENFPAVLINQNMYDPKIGLDFRNNNPQYLPAEGLTC